MTPLLTKWMEQEEEFEKKFIVKDRAGRKRFITMNELSLADNIKRFHRQSLIAIIEGEIERLEKVKIIIDPNDPFSKIIHQGYSNALKDQISYYQSTLEGLKKL